MTCCAKRPLVMVYVAVLSYFSVAFMGLATLPAYLQGVVIRDNPGASTEQVAAIYGNRFLVFTLLQGSLSVLVAGWAGRLSDRFGRRRCASLPAIGQAVGTGILAAAAYFQLDWRIALAGWAITGVLGGPYVFLAAAFAYIADWTTAEGRGRAFAGLEGVMLYVSAVGPLMAGPLLQLWGSLAASEDDRDSVGFAGLWGMCAIVYAVPAFCFALAQPSPQVLTPPAPCGRWVATSTPVLVARLLCEGRGGLNRLCIAFLLSLSSSMGGVQAFLLYAQSFLGWKEAKIGVFVAAFSGVTGSLILLSTLLLPRLLARCGRAPPHDLTMVRGAYLGPPAG